MRRQLVPLGSLCRTTRSLREFTMCCTRGGPSVCRGAVTLSEAHGSSVEASRLRSKLSSHLPSARPSSGVGRRPPSPSLLAPRPFPLPCLTHCRTLSTTTAPATWPLGLSPSRRVWLRRYGPMVLLNFGNVCALAGFLMTDVTWLRGFSLIATACGVTYNVLHDPPLRLPASWGLVFLCVNGCMLYSLLTEDEGVTFSDEAMDVFEEHFLPYGVTPRQFRKLLDIGTWHDALPGVVLAEEGRPLSTLVLIASGSVEALVGGQAIRSFSTFPGARHENGNKGIDAGAWIGEVNFLDGGGLKKAAGAIATFKAQTPTRYLQWDNNSLRQLMTGALVGKLLNFTTHTKNIHTQHYSEILSTVLVDEVVAPSEKKLLREYREQHHITDQAHKEALAQLGWTPEEFEDGMKHSPLMLEGAASAVRRINAGLVHRSTMNNAMEPVPPEAAQPHDDNPDTPTETPTEAPGGQGESVVPV